MSARILDIRFGAEAHHAFHARAIVPTAIEEHNLTGRGQVRRVALKVPLRFFALGGRAQRRDAAVARIEAGRDGLDRPTLPGGIAPFKDDDDLQALGLDPFLHLHQLDLQAREFFLILAPIELLAMWMLMGLGFFGHIDGEGL